MRQFESNHNFEVQIDKDLLINKTRDFLFRNSFRITGETEIPNGHSLHIQRGSETALRLLGALFTTSKQLPIKGNIRLMNNRSVEFIISSDIVGIGSSFGLENKFTNCFKDIINNYQADCLR